MSECPHGKFLSVGCKVCYPDGMPESNLSKIEETLLLVVVELVRIKIESDEDKHEEIMKDVRIIRAMSQKYSPTVTTTGRA